MLGGLTLALTLALTLTLTLTLALPLALALALALALTLSLTLTLTTGAEGQRRVRATAVRHRPDTHGEHQQRPTGPAQPAARALPARAESRWHLHYPLVARQLGLVAAVSQPLPTHAARASE